MANIEQGLPSISKKRYPVKQLLDLSKTAFMPFDLSKFSYAAARAGVVPPLSDCTMTSRRSSIQHGSRVSAETASISEEKTTYIGKQVQVPIRASRVPPTELRAQQDQGFAHFLKKHASPPHKRVTAGGRIVPMEPRSTPPAFMLNASNGVEKGSQSDDCYEASHTESHHRVTAENLHKVQAYTSQADSSLHNLLPMSLIVPSSIVPSTGCPHGMFSMTMYPSASAIQPYLLGSLEQDPTQCIPPSERCLSPTSGMFQGDTAHNSTHPVHGFPFATSTSEPFWQYSGTPTSFPGQTFVAQQELTQHQMSEASKSLSYWSQCFEELDRQLKNLDRHRAMSTLTPSMVEQRREIVQHRADTKAIMNRLEAFLGFGQQVVQASQVALNVKAPSYVPISQQTEEVSQAATALRLSKAEKDDSHTISEKPRLPGGKRPIPIVPPPDLKIDIAPIAPRLDSPEISNVVDAWGVNVGVAPPDLERQQSDMLESITQSVHSSSSARSSRQNLLLVQKSYSENDVSIRKLDDESSDDDDDIWSPKRSARAPPSVEATYKLQLDALRQPRGVETTISIPGGSTMTVAGQELQRPPTPGMTDFEAEYWSRKPPMATTMAWSSSTNTCESQTGASISPIIRETFNVQQEFQGESENTTVAPIGHRDAETNAFLAQFDSDDNEALTSQDETQSLRDLGLAQHDRNRLILQDIYGNIEPTMTGKADANLQPRSDSLRFSENLSLSEPYIYEPKDSTRTADPLSEDLYNKGYSSVSIQNIHAIAQPPQNFDGPVESQRGAQSLLGLAKQARSPGLLQRSGTNGTWFGPFRRGPTGRATARSEDHSPTRKSKLGSR